MPRPRLARPMAWIARRSVIALGVGLGHRRLAQHVIGEAIAPRLALDGA